MDVPDTVDPEDFPDLTRYEKALVPRAVKFFKLFRELMVELIFTNEMVVTPRKELVSVLLHDLDGSLFGSQQDLTEALGKIIELLSIIFKLKGKDMRHTSPFSGVEVQSIRYTDKNGDQKYLTKEIDFRNTFIDISPCLIDSIDNYFEEQPVGASHHSSCLIMQIDFEHSQAFRSVSLSKYPTCFAFRINRLSFDRETNQAVKSNQFVKFHKILRLERFRTGKEKERDARNAKLKELRSELAKKKERLTSLTTADVRGLGVAVSNGRIHCRQGLIPPSTCSTKQRKWFPSTSIPTIPWLR